MVSDNKYIRDLLWRFVYKHEIWHRCRPEHNKIIFLRAQSRHSLGLPYLLNQRWPPLVIWFCYTLNIITVQPYIFLLTSSITSRASNIKSWPCNVPVSANIWKPIHNAFIYYFWCVSWSLCISWKMLSRRYIPSNT